MSLQYTLVKNEDGESNLTVYVQGRAPLSAHSSYPNFTELVERTLADDETVIDLFDIAAAAALKFEKLSERVAIRNSMLYFDGVKQNNSLAEQIVRFVEDGVEDFTPLVNFFENIMQNPNEHSRENLYDWLTKQRISITPSGMMVGYKGVNPKYNEDGEIVEGQYQSNHSGTAIVDGQEMTGYVPNYVGAVVEMTRTEVMHNPASDCNAGLHVGSFDYAKGYAPVLLEVHVNPRDVVSVPDSAWKLRTCRYLVVDAIEQEYTAALVEDYRSASYDDEGYDDYDSYYEGYDSDDDGCGDYDCAYCYPDNQPDSDRELEDDELFQAAEELGIDLSPKAEAVAPGDVFEDADARRAGRSLEVLSVEDGVAVTLSSTGVRRSVSTDRLLSRKYRQV